VIILAEGIYPNYQPIGELLLKCSRREGPEENVQISSPPVFSGLMRGNGADWCSRGKYLNEFSLN
jgi:hypothetical protein